MADNKAAGAEVAMGWGILLCVFAAICWLIWHHFHESIRNAIRWLRYGEMWIVSHFVDDNYTVMLGKDPVNFKAMMKMVHDIPRDQIDNAFLGVLSTVAMTPLIYVFVAVTAVFAVWALFRGPGTEHRQTFNIDTLIKKQSKTFPIIAPFIDFNPSKQPPRPPGAPVPAELPIFAEALSPEEWIVYNEIPVVGTKLDEEALTKAFTRQLGPRWRGAKNLAPYKQIMLAAFCLKAVRKRADADVILGRLALCWSEKKGLQLGKDKRLLKEARAVLANTDISGRVLRKCNEHAWETTVMLRALSTAREEGGVLAPAQFVWLRAHDRTLWYPLNNMGRQSLHVEAMGAMAHYKAEKLVQRPIPRPKVEDAVKSLVEHMVSKHARPLPQMDYKNSKKRGVKKLKTA